MLFMLQKLPPSELLPVVRHLLTGCPRCLEVTRRLWDLGKRRSASEENELMKSEPWEGLEEARQQLRGIAADLETIAYRLLGVHASLPESAAESVPLLEEDEMEATTEIRAVIQCVLSDWLRPAVRDLRDAADVPAAAADEGGNP